MTSRLIRSSAGAINENLSPRSLNHYLSEARSFLNWLIKSERILANPLSKVSKVEEKGRATRVRRAFSDAELKALLKVAPDYRSIAYLTAARSGLRHGELAKLKWADVVFDSETPHILARAATTKNRLDSRIPMTKELEKELLKHRPKSHRANHPVFPKGVPRARTLRLDLEKAGIPYQDEMGRYADFHSLRYTWGTYLQRNGVNSRVAMELMRHSDRKLTDKIYTDSNLLPLGEVVRNLPDEENLIEILTEISGKTCRNGSRVGEIEPLEKAAQTALHAASRLRLSQSGDFETLVEVAGIEPASRNTSDPASTRVVHLLI